MKIRDLIRLYPKLYHMAAAGSWPSIRQHGLLSTSALVYLWQVSPPDVRNSLLGQRRGESVVIENAILGNATIRDQKPIHEPSLREALVDMTPQEWYRELNSRVFFFLQEERLSTLLNARSYRNDEHVVITIDTASFLDAHSSEVELCQINSGFAQRHSKAPRGRSTFLPIENYKHRDRIQPKSRSPWDVAELCLPGQLLDVRTHLISADRRRRDEVIETLEVGASVKNLTIDRGSA